MEHVAFIGAGNMGGAIVRAISKGTSPYNIHIFDVNKNAAAALAGETGCVAADSAATAAAGARYIFLCVKPPLVAPVLRDLLPSLQAGQTVCSIAAGVVLETLVDIQREAGTAFPMARIMPNTPAAVGQGVLLVTPCAMMTEENYADLAALLSPCGLVERVSEAELDLATAVTGCGPAYAYVLIEALADGAVQIGLSREKALRYAAQMLKGAAAMALESGKHPGRLKDEVCSPGGSTIAGVAALERAGFRAAAAGAVVAAYEKNRTLGK